MSISFDGSSLISIAEPLDRVQQRVVADMAPFFESAASKDQATTRLIARQMLDCYNAVTGKELQLAAQTAVFGIAALDCLSCSMSEGDLSVEVVLRMRCNAVTLNSLAEKSRKALDAWQSARYRGQAATPASLELDEVAFTAAIAKARQLVAFGRAKLEAHRVSKALAAGTPPAAQPAAPARAAPEVLVRRKEAELLWAKELHLQGQTMH